MSYEFPPSVEREVERYAEEAGVSPEEAAVRLVKVGLEGAPRAKPAFADTELAFDEALRRARAERRGPRPPKLEVAARSSVVGMLADRPDLTAAIDSIVADRVLRYAEER